MCIRVLLLLCSQVFSFFIYHSTLYVFFCSEISGDRHGCSAWSRLGLWYQRIVGRNHGQCCSKEKWPLLSASHGWQIGRTPFFCCPVLMNRILCLGSKQTLKNPTGIPQQIDLSFNTSLMYTCISKLLKKKKELFLCRYKIH